MIRGHRIDNYFENFKKGYELIRLLNVINTIMKIRKK